MSSPIHSNGVSASITILGGDTPSSHVETTPPPTPAPNITSRPMTFGGSKRVMALSPQEIQKLLNPQ